MNEISIIYHFTCESNKNKKLWKCKNHPKWCKLTVHLSPKKKTKNFLRLFFLVKIKNMHVQTYTSYQMWWASPSEIDDYTVYFATVNASSVTRWRSTHTQKKISNLKFTPQINHFVGFRVSSIDQLLQIDTMCSDTCKVKKKS